MTRSAADVLRKRGIRVQSGVLAATLCSFRIGGPVAALVEPQCLSELILAIAVCREEELPFAVIGRGSNLLFDDREIQTVLIRTTELEGTRILADGKILSFCGTPLGAICKQAAAVGYGGLEFAFGIPGTLGGGVFMNAGAYGGALSDVVLQATVLWMSSGKIETVFNQELGFSYRNSRLQKENGVLLSATMQLQPNVPTADIIQKMNEISLRRRRSQPLGLPNAGSVFKRSLEGVSLSAELDRMGLKGYRIGDAAVSEKHAGFIVNMGHATAKDVRALILEIQNLAEKQLGYRPTPEVRFIPEEL